MIDVDHLAKKELQRIEAEIRDGQQRLMRLCETCSTHCRESILHIEKELSNVRFEITVAVQEIEGEV